MSTELTADTRNLIKQIDKLVIPQFPEQCTHEGYINWCMAVVAELKTLTPAWKIYDDLLRAADQAARQLIADSTSAGGGANATRRNKGAAMEQFVSMVVKSVAATDDGAAGVLRSDPIAMVGPVTLMQVLANAHNFTAVRLAEQAISMIRAMRLNEKLTEKSALLQYWAKHGALWEIILRGGPSVLPTEEACSKMIYLPSWASDDYIAAHGEVALANCPTLAGGGAIAPADQLSWMVGEFRRVAEEHVNKRMAARNRVSVAGAQPDAGQSYAAKALAAGHMPNGRKPVPKERMDLFKARSGKCSKCTAAGKDAEPMGHRPFDPECPLYEKRDNKRPRADDGQGRGRGGRYDRGRGGRGRGRGHGGRCRFYTATDPKSCRQGDKCEYAHDARAVVASVGADVLNTLSAEQQKQVKAATAAAYAAGQANRF